MESPALVRAAGLIIYRRRQTQPQPQVEYLLLQASYGKRHWSPPKGHVDPGESDYQTALRETEEEAGFNQKVLNVVPDFKIELRYNVVRHGGNKAECPKLVTYWLAELLKPMENQVVLSEEHQDFKWLPLDKAMDLNGFADLNEELKKCQAKIDNM